MYFANKKEDNKTAMVAMYIDMLSVTNRSLHIPPDFSKFNNNGIGIKLVARTSGYLLYPVVVRSAGHYFIAVCRSLDTLATARYVEIGTESSKISKILKDSNARSAKKKL